MKNKDIIEKVFEEVLCPKCNNKKVTKIGIRYTEGRDKLQKYFCKPCNYMFVLIIDEDIEMTIKNRKF